MTDSLRPNGPDPTRNPSGYSDSAYAGQSPYGPTYSAPSVPNPTEPLPPYSQYGTGLYGTDQYAQYPPGGPPQEPPPEESEKLPRWLWALAALAVLIVVGLVIALVIANTSAKQQTAIAPLPAMTEPSFVPPKTTTTTTARPTIPVLPLPPAAPPGEPGATGERESVVYEVTGTGRAINITYVGTGSVMQTEFNVVLPWRVDVELPKPAQDSASVTVINVGRDVTCTVSVNGVQVRQRTGAGLTICTGSG